MLKMTVAPGAIVAEPGIGRIGGVALGAGCAGSARIGVADGGPASTASASPAAATAITAANGDHRCTPRIAMPPRGPCAALNADVRIRSGSGVLVAPEERAKQT